MPAQTVCGSSWPCGTDIRPQFEISRDCDGVVATAAPINNPKAGIPRAERIVLFAQCCKHLPRQDKLR